MPLIRARGARVGTGLDVVRLIGEANVHSLRGEMADERGAEDESGDQNEEQLFPFKSRRANEPPRAPSKVCSSATVSVFPTRAAINPKAAEAS